MNKIQQYFSQEKKRMLWAFLSVFAWGMLAHGYRFLNNTISHDSLVEMNSAFVSDYIKLGSGRIVVPVYRAIFRGPVAIPWLVGCLALFWIGAAVYLVSRIFKMESPVLVVLTAGIFTVNITVSGLAGTYLHDLDCNMFSMLCAVGAVHLWQTTPDFKRGGGYIFFLGGSILITISLGIYQSYVTVCITLAMIVCILELLDGETCWRVLLRGLRMVGMILLGGVIYYGVMRAAQIAAGIALRKGEYNTLDRMLLLSPSNLPGLILRAYRNCYEKLAFVHSIYPVRLINWTTKLLMLLCGGAFCVELWDRKVGKAERIFCMLLMALLPLGMNLLYVMTGGIVHDLMRYSVWLFYLLVLLLSDRVWKRWKEDRKAFGIAEGQRWIGLILIAALMYSNVQYANGMYLKKDIECDAYLSLMTRVADRMEMNENYVPGETPVAFVGTFRNGNVLNPVPPGCEPYQKVTGMETSDVLCTDGPDRYQAYFDNVMGIRLNHLDWDAWEELLEDPQIDQMPCYPAKGCVAFLGDVLVVKLGEKESE